MLSGWHMRGQPSETCRATSHDLGGVSGGGKLKLSFRTVTRHSFPERQAVPPDSQTEQSSANGANSKLAREGRRRVPMTQFCPRLAQPLLRTARIFWARTT